MNKTALSLILAPAIACLSLAACSKTTAPETPAPTPTAVAPQWVTMTAGTFIQDDGYGSYTHSLSSFLISKYEITYEQWYSVRLWALANGYVFKNAGREGSNGSDGAAPTAARFQPVTNICWRDAVVWCNAYSQEHGLLPVYCADAAFTLPVKKSYEPAYEGSINTMGGSSDNPYVNWLGTGARLPTEGEWQYAARYIDGSSWQPVNYASGASADVTDLTATAAVAWSVYDSGIITHAAGSKTANAPGLYDMSGNAREFCWDWYDSYPFAPQADYRGPATDTIRVMLGGGYYDAAALMSVSSKDAMNPWQGNSMTGFRIAGANP